MHCSLLPFSCLLHFILLLVSALSFSGCAEKDVTETKITETINSMTLRDRVAQKIILDFRYYCNDFKEDAKECREPVLEVPSEVASFLQTHTLGGVILFADNIQSIEQTVQLTHDLQRYNSRSRSKPPLFISIDQEGGKVVRLPRQWATSFPGNMAIAASPVSQRQAAYSVGSIMGAELAALGINVNHAPVVDVNTNSQNPVINVRSFSDQPERVAFLAGEMASGMMEKGIIPTLKHFPGHGDTLTDSHLDLPLVNHDLETAMSMDLRPFSALIEAGKAPMIMTAHIQFPALDDSKFIAKDGSLNYMPATLSESILTGLLRGKLGYKGVIVSDAMNMRAISERMIPNDATIAAFKAGIDLLLMPIRVQSKADLDMLDALIEHVVDNIRKGVISERNINDSVRRILRLKERFNISAFAEMPLDNKISNAKALLGGPQHRALEKDVAATAITELKPPLNGAVIIDDGVKAIHVVMPTKKLSSAFTEALKKSLAELGVQVESSLLNTLTPMRLKEILDNSDLVITGDVTPAGSPVDFGGMSDLEDWWVEKGTVWPDIYEEASTKILRLLSRLHDEARVAGKKTVFISLRFPVDALLLLDGVDAAYATYNFDTIENENQGTYNSPSIDALVEILVGDREARGSLPINLPAHNQKSLRPVVGAERMSLVTSVLEHKRTGLIVNQSSLVGDMHLVDALRREGVSVTKLFAVEHGIRGTEDAGAKVENSKDSRTGLPILSIYGKKKAPSKQDIADLDMLVFDLQDVGVRFYTYLSSLHYIMESCAENNIPLLILDRPNPNGAFVDGPILETSFQSFVGMHSIPVLHGMTLGELARMINGEGWLSGGATCDLKVIPIQNYRRSLEYKLPTKPSPNLPNQTSIQLYPSLALFEATNVSVGRGTEFPFQVLGGTRPEYGAFTFTPKPILGAALDPKLKGQLLYGKDFRGSNISGLNIDLFVYWYSRANDLNEPFLTRPEWLDKLMGTDSFRLQLEAGQSAADIRAAWKKGIEAFKQRSAAYLMYPD